MSSLDSPASLSTILSSSALMSMPLSLKSLMALCVFGVTLKLMVTFCSGPGFLPLPGLAPPLMSYSTMLPLAHTTMPSLALPSAVFSTMMMSGKEVNMPLQNSTAESTDSASKLY